MMSPKDTLHDFARTALNQGLPRAEIRTALLDAGWAQAQVDSALADFAEVDFALAVPRPKPALSAREAFQYVILFGTLYLSVFALGQLLFQFINLALPDPLWPEVRFRMMTEGIRWSVSALVVSWPVFLLVARANHRSLEADPVKRGSPIRRWLTYVTLAVAASVLIGDATSLVYSLLGGDLTTRFVLKALTIALLAGTAFVYYLSDLRQAEGEVAA
ncbi:MAG: hypothetical protein HKO98_06365 [Gemmatimonadetes bacterium]|nr:hypothetical protein [Gemmatimonadota bacterium]